LQCANNASEYCGGSSRLNVYRAGSLLSSTSIVQSSTRSDTQTSTVATHTSSLESSTSHSLTSLSSSTTSSYTQASSSTTSGSSRSSEASQQSSTTTIQPSPSPTQTRPSVKQTIGAYVFQGCYTEAASGRALSSKSYFNDLMTLELCAAACGGFQWFGVEYRRECYCGNALNQGSGLAANQADCNLLCPGDPTTFCGAGVRLQMYRLTSQSSTLISSGSSSLSSVVK
jgi:hypothetical protein